MCRAGISGTPTLPKQQAQAGKQNFASQTTAVGSYISPLDCDFSTELCYELSDIPGPRKTFEHYCLQHPPGNMFHRRPNYRNYLNEPTIRCAICRLFFPHVTVQTHVHKNPCGSLPMNPCLLPDWPSPDDSTGLATCTTPHQRHLCPSPADNMGLATITTPHQSHLCSHQRRIKR